MKNRLRPIIFLTVLFMVFLSIIVADPAIFKDNVLLYIGRPKQFAENTERFANLLFPMRDELLCLSRNIKLASGVKEFDGIFYCKDRLLEKFLPPENAKTGNDNTAALVDFAKNSPIPTAAFIIPTSVAIYQEHLPPYAAELQYNQRYFIEKINKSLSPHMKTVEAYPVLYQHKNEYIYYNTDSSLTAKGGYYLYNEFATRMGLEAIPHEQFNINFVSAPYYGKLYEKWGMGGVDADNIMYYQYRNPSLKVSVEHWNRYESKTYYKMFPDEATVMGDPSAIILGGRDPKITITNASAGTNGKKLLILGDSSSMAYATFLALHYEEVTLLDISLLTDSELKNINLGDYDAALCSYYLDNFLNDTNPARISLLKE